MLHGEIKVNDHVIGEWTATNTGRQRIEGRNEYDCTFNYTDLRGYKHEAQFKLEHFYGAGAAELALEVMTKGYVTMKPVSIFRSRL